jgi:hypothetical protein
VKSTPTRGVKQFLKPDAYKQSELQGSGVRYQVSGGASSWFLTPDSWSLSDGVPFV